MYIGLLACLSTGLVMCSEEGTLTVSQDTSEAELIPVEVLTVDTDVTLENFAKKLMVMKRKGGTALVRKTLEHLLAAQRDVAINPDYTSETGKFHALELTTDPTLQDCLLRNGYNPLARKTNGHTILEDERKQTVVKRMVAAIKRNKVEPFVIEALEGASVTDVVRRLRSVVNSDLRLLNDLLEASDQLITEEDIISILTTMREESRAQATVFTALLNAYKASSNGLTGHSYADEEHATLSEGRNGGAYLIAGAVAGFVLGLLLKDKFVGLTK